MRPQEAHNPRKALNQPPRLSEDSRDIHTTTMWSIDVVLE